MNSILRALSLVVVLGSAAYAQQPAPQGKQPAPSVDQAKPRAPLVLTKEQVERLADAEKTREIVKAQLQAAQLMLEKINAQIDGLIKDFQIELGLDPAKYDRDLRVLDQQKNVFGFLPKAEEQKPVPQQKTQK